MPPRRAIWLGLLAAAALTASQPVVAAPSARDKADAQKLVADAQTARKQERLADAANLLRKADALSPSAETKVELAQVLVPLGKLCEASKVLHAVVEDSSPQTPANKKAFESAASLLVQVEPKIPWVRIEVSGPGPGEATTTIDGISVEASTEMPFDPGEHEVAAEAEGFDRKEKRITLAEGEHEKVRFTLRRSLEAAADGADAPKGMPAWPAYAALGLGAVGIGVGTAFGVVAIDEADKAEAAKVDCRDGCNSLRRQDFFDAQEASLSNGTVSTVGFVVGGVGVVGGVVLLLMSKPWASTRASAPSVQPFVGAGEAGVVGTF